MNIFYGVTFMFRFYVQLFVLTAFSFILMPRTAASGQIPIYVSIVPQKYFVQQIGKERVQVQIMAPPGASPTTYEPRPQQMAALAKTKIYFAIGVPFEKVWLPKIAAANPNMLVVHTDGGIQKIPMETDHHHRQGDDDRHGILDPHIWTSPRLVKIQARYIFEALVEIDPANEPVYRASYEVFVNKLEMLDAEFKNIFSGLKATEFLVFHPAWGYLAKEYGLKQIPIEVEGKEPKPAHLQALIEHARERRVKVIFVQPQFSIKNAQTIAKAIDGQVVFADPLALNWEDNLRLLAVKFKRALR